MISNTQNMTELSLYIGDDLKQMLDRVSCMSNSEIGRRAKRKVKNKTIVINNDPEEPLKKPIHVIKITTPSDLLSVTDSQTRKALRKLLKDIQSVPSLKIDSDELKYIYPRESKYRNPKYKDQL